MSIYFLSYVTESILEVRFINQHQVSWQPANNVTCAKKNQFQRCIGDLKGVKVLSTVGNVSTCIRRVCLSHSDVSQAVDRVRYRSMKIQVHFTLHIFSQMEM